jgi:trimeric autotransporter adhesin
MCPRARIAAALAAWAALALAAATAQTTAAASAQIAATATAQTTAIPIELPGNARAGRIEWQRIEGARAYRATVLDSAGATVFDGETEEPGIDLALAPGSYKVRVAVLNKFMKQASVTPWMDIVVLRAVRPVPTRVWPAAFPAGIPEATLKIEGAGISKESLVTLESRGAAFMGRFVELVVAAEAPRADNLRERPAKVVGASFRFDLAGSNAGDYDVAVANPGGLGAVLPAALRLTPPDALVLPRPPKADESRSGPQGGALSAAAALSEPSVSPEPDHRHEAPVNANAHSASEAGAPTGSQSGVQPDSDGPASTAASGSAPSTAERTARGARKGKAFPRPDPKGLWLEASWGAAMFTSAGFSDRYGAALAGGSLGALASLPRLFKVFPSLGTIGLELRLAAASFPASSRATGSSTFLAAEAGGGVALRTDLAFPVNLAARLGGGLSASSVRSSSGVGSSSALSFDPAAYLSLGARLALGRHFLELGAEWRGTFYIDQLVQRIGAGLTLGWAL